MPSILSEKRILANSNFLLVIICPADKIYEMLFKNKGGNT